MHHRSTNGYRMPMVAIKGVERTKRKSRPAPVGTDGSIKAGALWEGEERAPTGESSADYAAAFTFAVISETRFEIGAKLSLASFTTISLVFEVCATAVSKAFLLFSA